MNRLSALIVCLSLLLAGTAYAQSAKWISANHPDADKIGTWIEFRKELVLKEKPAKAEARISADSKYWLWINGELAVFEGNLKRGPNPTDSYYDIVDLAPYLKKGGNDIKVLLCYFGKGGMSHYDTGKSALILDAPQIGLYTDSSWASRRLSAYGISEDKEPNYRLPESIIKYDARLADCDAWMPSAELGSWGDAPWNKLHRRPIPMWKDYGVKNLEFNTSEDGNGNIVLSARLPYNCQFTPVINLTDKGEGTFVLIETDHALLPFNTQCLYAEYITRNGYQEYESLGWLNGHNLYVIYPKDADITLHSLSFRETGYDCEFEGSFTSSDDFLNRYWKKAVRTLYVNMRDNYFDCPDRERAQWWGDVTHLLGQSFYQLSPAANALASKAIHELAYWQRPDGVLYAPVPEHDNTGELPAQILAAVGPYGFWHYYMHTGDRQTIIDVYPAVRKYLGIWKLDENGLTAFRNGDWSWGDWGENIDIRLILAAWHYLALDAAINMAEVTGNSDDISGYQKIRESIYKAFNSCWNGYAYRHPTYHLASDDRVQALAVVSGLADESRYDAIYNFFRGYEHASPYMEKYVLEALVRTGHGDYAVERFKKRFKMMTDDPDHDTLHEGWDPNVMGGGSFNHAWSGGMLNVTAEHICGVRPVEAGWGRFKICPYPVIKECDIEIPTVKGMVRSAFKDTDQALVLDVTVPKGTEAEISLPWTDYRSVKVNGKEHKGVLIMKAGTHQIIFNK